jgi:hypothetical protein
MSKNLKAIFQYLFEFDKAVGNYTTMTARGITSGAPSFGGGPYGFGNDEQLAAPLNPATQAIKDQDEDEVDQNVADQIWSLGKYVVGSGPVAKMDYKSTTSVPMSLKELYGDTAAYRMRDLPGFPRMNSLVNPKQHTPKDISDDEYLGATLHDIPIDDNSLGNPLSEKVLYNLIIEVLADMANEAAKTKKGKKVPGKYLKGLKSGGEYGSKSAMKREIDKYAGTDNYKKDWKADYTPAGERIKTKESEATKAYKKTFGKKDESNYVAEDIDVALKNKSDASNIPVSILRKVYSKGKAAWNTGHRPGVSQDQWAMGRVNSFITGKGGARKADKELWAKAKKSKSSKANESHDPGMSIIENILKEYIRNIVKELTSGFRLNNPIKRGWNNTTINSLAIRRNHLDPDQEPLQTYRSIFREPAEHYPELQKIGEPAMKSQGFGYGAIGYPKQFVPPDWEQTQLGQQDDLDNILGQKRLQSVPTHNSPRVGSTLAIKETSRKKK